MTTDNSRADALTDLLPCPFCNGTSEFDSDDSGYHWVACRSCGASSDTARHCDDDCRERLTAAWNTRATPPVEQPAAAPMPPNAQLRRVMDLLDAHLGDSDPTLEGMTQEEIEEEFPVVAAMQIIVGLYQDPPTASDTAPSPADEQHIEAMARAMNVATDGHDRYWTGYVRSATAALRALRKLHPAPSPADERAAIISELRAAIEGECDGLHTTYQQGEAILSHVEKFGGRIAAVPVGYICAEDMKELAVGNGAIVSPRCNETDVPVFARAASASETVADGARIADDMRAEQTYLGSCREACDNSGRIRWDRLQRVIDFFESRSPAMAAEAVALPQPVLDALRFYANGHHFNIDEDHQQFDTVSGEPQNWLFSERDDDCTMIEDGRIAKAVLQGIAALFEEPPPPIEGEVFAAPQPAQADAPAEARPTSFHFHRFVDGQKMAEDVLIERERTLDAAIQAAVRACPKRPVTVLVHAPALRDASTDARVAQADARVGLTATQLATIRLGLTAAKHFIANGIELGFIRMPDANCPDPAHDTPKLVDEALALLQGANHAE